MQVAGSTRHMEQVVIVQHNSRVVYKQSLVLLQSLHFLEHITQEADKRRHCWEELHRPTHELVLLHMV